MVLLEPFAGSGTTNIVADSLGFKYYGFEGHPFVEEIAQAKQHWFLSTAVIRSLAMNVLNEARSSSIQY
ncbi:site-specific DNA-methyltransferase, partial [Acinetobacter baumannii]|nr:site-specific DNA-methyltransferase [Acinetobacter baumannii]